MSTVVSFRADDALVAALDELARATHRDRPYHLRQRSRSTWKGSSGRSLPSMKAWPMPMPVACWNTPRSRSAGGCNEPEVDPQGAADLDAIYDHYVVLIGPEKALKAVQDIVEQVKPLQQVANQGAGRPSEVPGVRTLTLERWPFSAPFRVKGKEIQILRIDRVEITP